VGKDKGFSRGLFSENRPVHLWRQFLAVRLVVAVPTDERGIVGVYEKRL
jgi:hypothetical protein